jgi:hypothetical protein
LLARGVALPRLPIWIIKDVPALNTPELPTSIPIINEDIINEPSMGAIFIIFGFFGS